MELAALIISSISLIAIVVLMIFNLKKKPENSHIDQQEIGAIKNQIDQLSKDISLETKSVILEQMVKSNETNNDKLERFQNNISDSINKRFDSLNLQMDKKLDEMNKKVDDKLAAGFKDTNETFSQVRERLQAIDDAQKNIEALSSDVVSLKQVLEGNQTRGQYGEYQLQMVLHNVFGDTEGCYQEQYTMHRVKDGDDVRADAVVFVPEPNKMICIDSKFPFADYQKLFDAQSEEEKVQYLKDFSNAVKKHITVIKDKYIVEGKTAPEALMFIPNDGVFAFIYHNCQEVVEYAREKRVVLTSPSTLPPILATINMVRIETNRAKNLNEISKQLTKLGKEFVQFSKEWDSFSRQLDTASKTREKLDNRVGKITTKFDSIKDSSVAEIEESSEEIDLIEDDEIL